MRLLRHTKVLSAAAIGIVAAACSVQTPLVVPQGLEPNGGATHFGEMAPPSKRRRSWMLPEAKHEDLLYVTGLGSMAGGIFVYTYPAGKLEGVLINAVSPESDCADPKGNIWVADAGRAEILEYAHGGTSPIAVLDDKGFVPYGCSVDPTTGNLAVTNYYNLAIYSQAKGSAKLYHDPSVEYYTFDGYDPKGNLFVSGIYASGLTLLMELPKGSSSFRNLSLYAGVPFGVQWDGKYMTFGDILSNTIWAIEVTKSGARFVHQTGLFGAGSPVYQFTYSNFRHDGQAARVVAMDTPYSVAVWNYPEGGTPRKIYTGSYYALGAAISPASK